MRAIRRVPSTPYHACQEIQFLCLYFHSCARVCLRVSMRTKRIAVIAVKGSDGKRVENRIIVQRHDPRCRLERAPSEKRKRRECQSAREREKKIFVTVELAGGIEIRVWGVNRLNEEGGSYMCIFCVYVYAQMYKVERKSREKDKMNLSH